MKLTTTTMSLKQALMLYVLYGIAAVLIARNGPPAVRRWRVLRDFAVEVRDKLTYAPTSISRASRATALVSSKKSERSIHCK
jgi:hypothetical protein